ncbi:unnamed protein product [Paramecium sonneborni]|uniref:Uncharacterized protein n=1 Tax=Paramecium sonneborni TaxID=65129 RepID=A0A8S1M0J2_9CILI|nr:unnamed protein product [Paramecium sonneborni]
MSNQRFDIVRQGLNITSGMKSDIVDLYKRALSQKQYQNKADYVRYHLEQKYVKDVVGVFY